MNTHQQTTGTVMMVRPTDFGFNPETASDNEFQHKPGSSEAELRDTVLREFDASVSLLESNGIRVLVLEKGQDEDFVTPDAVFPNNWLSTRADGEVLVYPMRAMNRRLETKRLPLVLDLFSKSGLQVERVTRWDLQLDGAILEGTGSLIFDHPNKRVYASLSPRTEKAAVEKWAAAYSYEPILYHAHSSKGMEFYHTNVVLSIGDGFSVVDMHCIKDAVENKKVIEALSARREVITLAAEQTETAFCANILHLKGNKGPVIALSETAWNGFTPAQKQRLEAYGTPAPLPIPTIESVGGGSARCMLAEIFLPAKV